MKQRLPDEIDSDRHQGPRGSAVTNTVEAMSLRLPLTIEYLKVEAATYGVVLSATPIPELYGVTDGKAVGTHVELAFKKSLAKSYDMQMGNAALGIDLPSLGVDLKVTSLKQPQSSSPFRDATQKVYGLGYHLLVFVYSKKDDHAVAAARLTVEHVVFIDQSRTADFQTTSGIRLILSNNGNVDDLDAFFQERNLPLDDVGRRTLAERVMLEEPAIGALTISNALQWRLQYGRAIAHSQAGSLPGVEALLK